MPGMESSAHTFRFLDLPTELRLMVYHHISPTATHHKIVLPTRPNDEQVSYDAEVTLVTKSLPVSLLATCRAIHDEALPFFHSKLPLLDHCRPQVLLDITSSDVENSTIHGQHTTYLGFSRARTKFLRALLAEYSGWDDALRRVAHFENSEFASRSMLIEHQLRDRYLRSSEISPADLGAIVKFRHRLRRHLDSDAINPGVEVGYRPIDICLFRDYPGYSVQLPSYPYIAGIWLETLLGRSRCQMWPKIILVGSLFADAQDYEETQSAIAQFWKQQSSEMIEKRLKAEAARTRTSQSLRVINGQVAIERYDLAQWKNETRIVEDDAFIREWAEDNGS